MSHVVLANAGQRPWQHRVKAVSLPSAAIGPVRGEPQRDRLRLKRDAAHLQRLGPRSVAECLLQIGRETGDLDVILRVLADYRRLTAQMVSAVGADRFPPRPLHAVPASLEGSA